MFTWLLGYILVMMFGVAPQPVEITDAAPFAITDQMAACTDAGYTVVILFATNEFEAACLPVQNEDGPEAKN